MSDSKGVLIVGESSNGNIAAMTTELLGIGRKLADDLGEELSAVLMGDKVGGQAEEAIKFGADKVYVIESPLLKAYITDAYMAAMAKLCEEIKPTYCSWARLRLAVIWRRGWRFAWEQA